MRIAVPGPRWRRFLLSSGISIAAVTGATLAFGPVGFAVAFAVGLLSTAWYSDDHLGTCLPIAVLFLLVLIALAVLLGLTVLAFRI